MDNWFTRLTGLPDDRPKTARDGIAWDGTDLICPNGRVMSAGSLSIPSLAELRELAAPVPSNGATTVREVVADVQALHHDPANAGAMFQVASQFNLLEMIGPSVSPDDGIARYSTDKTQGPACAIACAAGTIYRNYFVPTDGQTGQSATKQIDTLTDLGKALGNHDHALWDMRNGYALPRADGIETLNRKIAGDDHDHLRDLIRIGVQADTEVTLDDAGHRVTQVYCSALPIAYSDLMPWHLAPFGNLILEAAYEATLLAALQHAKRTGNKRVYLTRLGGGAFGNAAADITAAIARAVNLFPDAGLDIVIVSYGAATPANAPLLTHGS
ncbi:hypothetical protein [Yoonia sp. 208BN28-4]|uniref:hypothetical protein n=1 Tax=Yoonia sp. 208BN28-4 TaxID=3126505 RepID=UPI0030AD8B5C